MILISRVIAFYHLILIGNLSIPCDFKTMIVAKVNSNIF